jgi:hypothetical protein
MKNISHKTTCTNGLPGDKDLMLETSRRRRKIELKINLKSVHLLVYAHNCFKMRGTKNTQF